MREQLRQPMLNAVRAFEAAARLGSLKAAATALGVTSSAVSHQVRQLEQELGQRLFIRRNNAIEMTREGLRLFEEVGPALRMIARATEATRIERSVVALNVSNAFAQLWLVPRLADFQKRHPRIAVEMDTVRRPIVLDDSVEMIIPFSRRVPASGAIELLQDFSRPMAAKGLWDDKSGRARDIREVPLISSTPDDWCWRLWAAEHDIDFAQLRVAYRFDCECAASAACTAGLGVALLNTADPLPLEVASGLLVPFGASRQLYFGSYWLVASPRLSRPAQIFRTWLLRVALRDQPGHNPTKSVQVLRLHADRTAPERPIGVDRVQR